MVVTAHQEPIQIATVKAPLSKVKSGAGQTFRVGSL